MTNRVAHLASITIDCPNPEELAPFYKSLLGLEEDFVDQERDVICLSGAGLMVTLMRVAEYEPPTWPHGPQFEQMHLDLVVDDLDADVAAAMKIGAREAEFQPWPERWRVMLDPVGHPFCLGLARADSKKEVLHPYVSAASDGVACMPPVTFTDDATMSAEAVNGLVQLVTRDRANAILDGREFTPLEAHQLAQDLATAAFAAQGQA